MRLKYEENDRKNKCEYKVYEGDCLNMIDDIKENTIDLVVTSPPYNIGKEYEEKLTREEYLEFSKGWIKRLDKVLKDNGSFWLNIGFFKQSNGRQYIPWEYYFYPLIKKNTSLKLVQQVIWHYGAGVNCKKRFSPRKETWLYYVKNLSDYTFNLDEVRIPHKYPNQKKNGKLKVNPIGKNPGDVWKMKKVTSGKNRSSTERTDHPAQFPEAVIKRIVKVSSNPKDYILDPFLGSGTTMKVARDLDRNCIGIEIEEEYLDNIVKNRVFDKYSRQKKLDL